MNFLLPELDFGTLLTGAATAMAGLAMGGRDTGKDNDLDLDDAETNYMTMLKIRADLSGDDFFFAFPGEAWAMVPEDGCHRLLKTFGIGSSHLEEVPEGWRIIHREVLYYIDPNSGEILNEWKNPLNGKTVDVMHIANDPVNGTFMRDGKGVLAAPYPYVAYGDDIIFQWNFFIHRPNAMPRKDYPLYSQSDFNQHAELWGIQGRKSDVLNPDITSAPGTMSWCRVAPWLPFMEMGDAPGIMVYHSHSMKLMGGVGDLPRDILDYTEKHYTKYLESPKEWVDPKNNQSSYSEFKKMIDQKNAAG